MNHDDAFLEAAGILAAGFLRQRIARRLAESSETPTNSPLRSPADRGAACPKETNARRAPGDDPCETK